MEEGTELTEAENIVDSQGENVGPRLLKIGYNPEDNRTGEEKALGMPLMRNDGFVSVELDLPALVNLLKNEGLTAEQINALQITYSAARIVDVDAAGDPIGGLHKGNKIIIYTSLPVYFHSEENPPQINKDRFETFHSVVPVEELTNSTLHELKHYIQYCQGVSMPSSWAAESQEVHDALPTEKEANEFAEVNIPKFIDKFRVYDESGHFKDVSEVAPKEKPYVTGLVNDKMVARFIEDSPEASLAHEYIMDFEEMMSQPHLDYTQIVQFIEKGKEAVGMKAISGFEADFMLDKLQAKSKG